MKLRNGAHVDRILDIDPIATSAIAQHNASSPLLRLPLEVKNQIYEYTVGGNLIHVITNPEEGAAKFKNTICCARISEQEAEEDFESESTHEWYAPAIEGRHNCCRFQDGATSHDEKAKPEVLNLGLLRCCRQIYNEAHHIPYSTNTFSCLDPKTLQSFVISLAQGSKNNHLAVRSLFLEMVYGEYDHRDPWGKALTTCVKHLKALQNVHISIDWRKWASTESGIQELRNWGDFSVTSILLKLKKLSLKTATMIISDQWAEELRDQRDLLLYGHVDVTRFARVDALYRWTLNEKRERARYVKEVLLQSSR